MEKMKKTKLFHLQVNTNVKLFLQQADVPV